MSIYKNGQKVMGDTTTVPITQTIDASSTEKEIPSAKAVNTLLNNKVNKMAMLTSQNIDDLVNEGSFYVIEATNAPDAYGWVDVLANNDYTIQLFYPSITTNCEMYIRRRQNGVWEPWQKVCTTSVADVPVTKLTVTGWASGNVYYCVKNGICYVHVSSLLSTTMSTYGQVIANGLPKPIMPGEWHTISAGLTTGGTLLVQILDNGAMCNYIGSNEVSYFGSFSYPIAES